MLFYDKNLNNTLRNLIFDYFNSINKKTFRKERSFPRAFLHIISPNLINAQMFANSICMK